MLTLGNQVRVSWHASGGLERTINKSLAKVPKGYELITCNYLSHQRKSARFCN